MDRNAKERSIQPYDLNTFDDTIRKNLVWYRNHSDLGNGRITQEDMAEFMNISKGKYSKLETGGTGLHLDDLLAVCNIHHIRLEDLLTKPGAEMEAEAPVRFTDKQVEVLKEALVGIFEEFARTLAGDNSRRHKKRRPREMER